MKAGTKFLLFLLPFFFGFTLENHNRDKDWQTLFNGKDFSGWNTYLGPPFDSAGKRSSIEPIGLNKDPKHVFSIVQLDGENVIRISGENFGVLTSKKAYGNYHLQLMFRWGNLQWPPKKGQKKDSGILYHSVGDYTADGGFWMRSQEFQVEEGNCGDYWGVAGAGEDVRAIKKSDSEYVYNPAAELTSFSENSKAGRHCIKRGDAENPTGEWNTLDLYCFGDTSVHVVNGKAVMVLVHSRQTENGTEIPLVKGAIQIQCEGAEVYYKNIRIKSIDNIPAELLNQ